MTPARTLLVVLLVGLLAVDLAAANALVAADRTVLNPGFVTTSLQEEAAYEAAESLVIEAVAVDELPSNETPPLPVDPEVVVAAAVDPAYLQSQVEPNVHRAYAYLHGRSDELDLRVNAEPAKVAIVDAVEAELTNATAGELVQSVAGGGDLSVEAGGVSLDLVTVAEMSANESAFRAERAELRTAVRDRVIDGLVDDAYAQTSSDGLLSLVIENYDPEAYTDAEKTRLVDDREADIRAALRTRIEAEDSGEIAAAVDDQLAALRATARANVSASLDEALGDVDPAVAEPATHLVLVAVDGYVADTTHAAFSAEFEAAGDDLAVAVASLLEAELDGQVPDRVDLTEDLEPEAAANLENVRQLVRFIDLLTLVLPLVGLALVGAVYLVCRSVTVAAIGAGIGLVVGGLPALVGATQLPGRLASLIVGNELPAGMESLVLALAGRVADAVLLQSMAVVGLGLAVLGAGLALHFELVEWPAATTEP